MKNATETADALIALVQKLEGHVTRARISEKTIARLAERRRLRNMFVRELTLALDDRSWALLELNRGGFGLLSIDVLEGARPITLPDIPPEEDD